jgi:hypothetical protein
MGDILAFHSIFSTSVNEMRIVPSFNGAANGSVRIETVGASVIEANCFLFI